MRIVCDTSVLVAAMVEQHPGPERAFPWLSRAKRQEIELCVTTRPLADLYAVLTTLPVRPRIAVGVARRLIRENVEAVTREVPVTKKDYQRVLDCVAELGLSGGSIYDALVATVCERLEAQRLLTFNLRDFRRVRPGGHEVIQQP